MNRFRSLAPLLTLLLMAFAPGVAEGAFGLVNSLPAPHAPLPAGAELGSSVAVDGTFVVVGAPKNDTGATHAGIVEVFHADTGALLWTLTNPAQGADHGFGYSVAISGTRVVVGAPSINPASTHPGAVYIYDLASGTPATPVFTLSNPTPAKFDLFGFSVSISGSRVAIGAMRDDTVFVDAGAVYLYDLAGGTPTTPTHSLFNPGPAGDYFGCAVSISGTRVVAGAVRTDVNSFNDAGAAYVYDIAGGTPDTPIAVLPNPTPATVDKFGQSVAISGSRVVVGAFQDNTGGSKAGSIYVYDVGGAFPTTPLTINNPFPATQDHFGWSVSISGNLVVAGADQDDDGATDAGSAYVFDLSSGTPGTPVHELNNPFPAEADRFGLAVAISGNRVAVGAPMDEAGAADAGSAYVYDLAAGPPPFQPLVLSSVTPDKGSHFGHAVAISSQWILVAAPFDEADATDSGRVYVYDRDSATPAEPAFTLVNSSIAAGDRFGFSCAISGDRVVVGATGDDTGATDAGIAYVYDLAGANPTQPILTLNNPGPNAGDGFGSSVAISESSVAVAAMMDDSGIGIVYVYELNGDTPALPLVTVANPTPAANDHFGASVSLSGTKLLVGAPGDDTAGTDTGAAYAFVLGIGPIPPHFAILNPSPSAEAGFGSSVAVSGARLVVGAFNDDTGAANSGAAYVYNMVGVVAPSLVTTLFNPAPGIDAFFGADVDISGTRVAIGTPGAGGGIGYLYDLGSGTPNVPVQTMANPSSNAFDYFGNGIALDGLHVAIGAPGDDTFAPDQGYAYLFGPPPPGSIAIDGSLFTVNESAGVVNIPLIRTGGAGGIVTVTIATTNGTAKVGDDFNALDPTPKVITFADDQTEAQVPITLITPGKVESNESFTVTLSDATGGASLGSTTSARIVIVDAGSDAVKPTVTITAPAANAKISDASPTVTVSGKAWDNKGVRRVQVRLNNGEFEDALIPQDVIGNPNVTFSHTIEPSLGLNTLEVQSLDEAGNISTLATRSFTFIAFRNLVVNVDGPANSGSVSDGFLGSSTRQVGVSYSVTATAKKTPAPGFFFAGWTVSGGPTLQDIGVTAAALNSPALKFTFREGLVLTANFVVYPFTTDVVGAFNGLILPSGASPLPSGTTASHETVGMIAATVTTGGGISGKLFIDGLTLNFAGTLDESGVARFTPTRALSLIVQRGIKPSFDLSLQVDLDPSGTGKLTGVLTQYYRSAIRSVCLINADRAHYGGKGPMVPENLAGASSRAYTAVFPARDSQAAPLTTADYPLGDGFANVTVKTNGLVSLVGKLADGTPITASAPLSKANTWPLFQQLYKWGGAGRGCIAGMIAVDDTQPETDMLGTGLQWFRPFQLVQWYPYGWEEGVLVDFIAAKYTAPKDASVIPGLDDVDPTSGNVDLTFSDGLLDDDLTLPANISPKNAVTKPSANTDPNFTLKITAPSGQITGTFTHDDGAKTAFSGITYQKGPNAGAYGYFLTTSPKVPDYLGQSGRIELLAK